MSDLQIYSDDYDFETEFKNIFDLVTNKKQAKDENEKRWLIALEKKSHFILVYFQRNRLVPGSMKGIGKEPDTPNDTSKESLRNYGKALKKNGLHPDFFFLLGEEPMLNTSWLFVTGVKVSTLLNTRPHAETYKLEVFREKKGEIQSITEMIKVPAELRPKHHDLYINGFLDMDNQEFTSLEKLLYWRGNK